MAATVAGLDTCDRARNAPMARITASIAVAVSGGSDNPNVTSSPNTAPTRAVMRTGSWAQMFLMVFIVPLLSEMQTELMRGPDQDDYNHDEHDDLTNHAIEDRQRVSYFRPMWRRCATWSACK